ncbi:MAG TPA: alkene reductase [Pyrinomonadaceae bacterium]|jgi:N-ethylmaleimide reductase
METRINLFAPIKVGPYELPNRIVMSPMTRSRAGAGNAPTDLTATYYAQRATAGLIVTEATQVSPQGIGYPNTPGIHTAEQVSRWRVVTQAVHKAGGKIFLQLWHVGRISHPSMQEGGALPVAPSAIAPRGEVFTGAGMKPFVTPRALLTEEIPGIVEQFRVGAANALKAGFDGVEIHGANGYLIDQFLEDSTNKRTDLYGGAVENRARFLLEVTEAVVGVWGDGRVGVRLSPGGTFNSMHDSDPASTFGYAAQALNRFPLAYLHVVEPSDPQQYLLNGAQVSATRHLRSLFEGTLITAQGYNFETANAVLARGEADLVGFGVLFLANPDLPARFALGAPLNEPDPETFYGGDEHGYTDYPALELQTA